MIGCTKASFLLSVTVHCAVRNVKKEMQNIVLSKKVEPSGLSAVVSENQCEVARWWQRLARWLMACGLWLQCAVSCLLAPVVLESAPRRHLVNEWHWADLKCAIWFYLTTVLLSCKECAISNPTHGSHAISLHGSLTTTPHCSPLQKLLVFPISW